ncbi:unnamed protein product, partial [Meganyctiphanes norvegica]
EISEAVNALTAVNNRLDDQRISIRDTDRSMDVSLRAARSNEQQIQAMLRDAQDTQSVARNLHQSVMKFQQQVEEMLKKGISITESSYTTLPIGTLPSVEKPLPECPEKYIAVGKKCYRIESEHSKNWFEAREICQLEESDLAMPEDINVLKAFLYDDGVYTGIDFWLGASDLDQEGSWRWLSGKEMHHNWDELQPDGGNRENCMEIRPGNESRLHDYYCYNKQNFICQRDIGPFSKTEESPALACPEGFFQLETQCFRVVDNQMLYWGDARSFCRDQGGDLAQPQDPQALRHVLLTNNIYNVWIGAYHAHGSDKNWTWVSGKEVTDRIEEDAINENSYYEDDYEVEYEDDPEFCLRMKTESRPFFIKSQCNEMLSFVCQRSPRPLIEGVDSTRFDSRQIPPVAHVVFKGTIKVSHQGQ